MFLMKKFILIFVAAFFILLFSNHKENLFLLEENTLKTQIEDLEDLKRAYPKLNWNINDPLSSETEELNQLFFYWSIFTI